MSFSEDYLNDDYDSYFDEEEAKSKVITCKEHIENGRTFANLDSIDETIQLCLEYDFVEDGLYLTEAVLHVAPYNSEAWQYKGIFLNNTFEFEEAYHCFEKAMSFNPNDVETYINKSISEDNLGLYDDAVESLNKALRIEPNNEETLFSLGVLCEKKEKFSEAIDYFTRSVKSDPEYIEAWYELGYCFENTDQLDLALNAYDKYLELEPNSLLRVARLEPDLDGRRCRDFQIDALASARPRDPHVAGGRRSHSGGAIKPGE